MSDEPTKIILGDTAISAIEDSGRRRFFRRKNRQRPPLIHCENCGAQLSGKYCSVCGQPAIDYRRSFRHVIVDVLDSFLNWDSKFFQTIGLLITRPWCLTNEFLAGRRVRYLHPARLYLLASILFFFAATYWVKSVHMDRINLSPEQRAEIKNELERENVAPEVRAKVEQALGGVSLSPEKRAEMEAQLKREDLPEEERVRIEQKLEEGDLPPDARAKMEDAMKDLPPEARAKVDQALKQKSDQQGKSRTLFETDGKPPSNSFEKWIESRAKEKFGEHGTNIQLFLVTLMSNLPYMMLACIPLFAFVLKVLYIRKRIFYIDHLVYALHIHTFAYLAIILIVLATIGLNRSAPGVLAGWIIGLLWAIFAIQIFLSIRRVYRQGWFFSIFKFFTGGFVYLIVLCLALAATFFITLALP
jgi:hypothetical protein